MGVELMKSESNFAFHLDGDSSIDASLLANTIKDMAELTKLAAKEVNPEAYIKMNVTAFKNGSFQIEFSTICEVLETAFSTTAAVAGLALTVVGTVKGFFEIKKLLKGKKPESITEKPDGKIEIKASDGNSICVSKSGAAIMNNVKIDQLIVNISNNVLSHNPDGGFTFHTSNEDLYCSSDDIKSISKPLPIEESVVCKRARYQAIMPIKSLDLLGYSQWGFIYNDRTIKATISDEDFIEKVHNGEIIKAGDSIETTLEVYVDLDVFGKPIEGTEKYTVLKVHGDIIHKDEAEQINF